MYRLFTDNNLSYGKVANTQMNQVRNIILDHYTYQQNLFKTYGGYVNSNHPLIRLCYMLSDFMNASADTYRLVSNNLHSICSSIGITSESSFGKIFNNCLYTEWCTLAAVTFNDQIPYIKQVDWRDMRPVRCFSHPYTSMELFVAPVNRTSVVPGISSIGIDLPLLALQFKSWVNYNNTLPDGDQESMSEFIFKYVLVGMLKEYIDIALRNRLRYIAIDEDVPKQIHERGFVTSYEQGIIHPIKNILDNSLDSSLPYYKALKQIPFIFSDSYFDAVPRELSGLNIYMYWVQALTLIDWVTPMAYFVSREQNINTDMIKTFKRVDRFIATTGCLDHMPGGVRVNWEYKYEKIKEYFI